MATALPSSVWFDAGLGLDGIQVKAKVADRVVVANVAHDGSQQLHVSRILALLDPLADHAAQHATEVLMTRVGQEGAGIGKHAHKVAQHALVSQSRELLAHTDLVVVEPPGRAVLDLAGGRSLLEAAYHGIDHGVVDGVQAVQDGLGQTRGLLDGVEEIGQLVGRRVVGDTVVAGVGFKN